MYLKCFDRQGFVCVYAGLFYRIDLDVIEVCLRDFSYTLY